MSLSRLDGKRVAVVLDGKQERSVFRGTARYQVDKDLGPCLRIPLSDQPGNPHFFFPESTDGYEFLPDREHGCDYYVTLPAKAAGAATGSLETGEA